jgi:hypothetical protein
VLTAVKPRIEAHRGCFPRATPTFVHEYAKTMGKGLKTASLPFIQATMAQKMVFDTGS